MRTTLLRTMTLVAVGTSLAAISITTAPQNREVPFLDKTGTSGVLQPNASAQTTKSQPFATAGSLRAEREGFEPSVNFRPHRFSRPAHSAALAPLRRSIKVILASQEAPEKRPFRRLPATSPEWNQKAAGVAVPRRTFVTAEDKRNRPAEL